MAEQTPIPWSRFKFTQEQWTSIVSYSNLPIEARPFAESAIDIYRAMAGAIVPNAAEIRERLRTLSKRISTLRQELIETLSSLPLGSQVGADGATWLDRELVGGSQTAIADAGFGREVCDALARRRQWLIEQDFARQEQDRIVVRANLLSMLRRRELARVGGQLSNELGLPYAEPQPGERITGVYRRRLDLASGRFALIEKSREIMLVPWRPVLERNLGKRVSGLMRREEISWTLGRQRGGPSIGA